MNEGNLCETQLRPNLHYINELTKTPGNDCRNYQCLNKWIYPFSPLVLSFKAYCGSHLLVAGHTFIKVGFFWPHVWEAVFSSIKVSLCLTEGLYLTTIRNGKQATYNSLLVVWSLCFRAHQSRALECVAEARFIHLCKRLTRNCSYWSLLLM